MENRKVYKNREEYLADPDRDKSQEWFWTEEWQAMEAEAEEDKRLGRVKSFDSIEDALKWLDSGDEEE